MTLSTLLNNSNSVSPAQLASRASIVALLNPVTRSPPRALPTTPTTTIAESTSLATLANKRLQTQCYGGPIEIEGTVDIEKVVTAMFKRLHSSSTTKRKSYTREYKLAAVRMFRETGSNNYKTSRQLGITSKVLREWVRMFDKIYQQKGGTRRAAGDLKGQPQYPALEEMLYDRFVALRDQGLTIKSHWFYAQAKSYYEMLWPEHVTVNSDGEKVYGKFKFSEHWFNGFKKRRSISLRRLTNKAQVVPELKEVPLNDFHQFIRKKSLPNIPKGEKWCDIGKFELGDIANVDQTPMPFEFLSGTTYDHKGARTVWAKSLGSGLHKRQCTVQLCIHADGRPRSKPLIVFHGKGTRLGNEAQKWDRRVSVMFNEKAWVDSTVFLKWITHEWSVPHYNPRLLALDCHKVHLTPQVLDLLRRQYTLPTIVPEGCTSLVQPLDVAINKTFKDLVERCYQRHYQENLNEWTFGKVKANERRILITRWVGEAWDTLHRQHADLIRKSFRKTGIAVALNGAEDKEIHIQGLENYKVRNWWENPKFNFDAVQVLEASYSNRREIDEFNALPGGACPELSAWASAGAPRLVSTDLNGGYCSDEECPYVHPSTASIEAWNGNQTLLVGLPGNEARDLDGILEHVDTERVPVPDGEFANDEDSDAEGEYVREEEIDAIWGENRQ